MTYCGEHTAVKETRTEVEAISLRCRSWLCDHCYPTRKRGLMANMIGGKPNTFLTLTCRRSEFDKPEDAARALSHAWRLVRLRAIRESKRDLTKRPQPAGPAPEGGWPRMKDGTTPRQVILTDGKLPFITVVEAHKSGWPHLHILARSKWIGWQWLSLQMTALLNSPIVSVMRLTEKGRIAAYCAKYCGKCAHKYDTTKRYWQSHDFDLRLDEDGKDAPRILAKWERREIDFNTLVARLTVQGWQVHLFTIHHALARRTGPP